MTYPQREEQWDYPWLSWLHQTEGPIEPFKHKSRTGIGTGATRQAAYDAAVAALGSYDAEWSQGIGGSSYAITLSGGTYTADITVSKNRVAYALCATCFLRLWYRIDTNKPYPSYDLVSSEAEQTWDMPLENHNGFCVPDGFSLNQVLWTADRDTFYASEDDILVDVAALDPVEDSLIRTIRFKYSAMPDYEPADDAYTSGSGNGFPA